MSNDTKGIMIRSEYFKGNKKTLKNLLKKAKSIAIKDYIDKYHSKEKIDYTIFGLTHGYDVLNEITRRLQNDEEITRDDLYEMIDGLDKTAQFDFRAIRIYNNETMTERESEVIALFPFNDVHLFEEHKQMAVKAIQEDITEMNTEDPDQEYYFFRDEDELVEFYNSKREAIKD